MKDQFLLGLYVVLLLLITNYHNLYCLMVILISAFIYSYRALPTILIKTLRALFFFNIIISISYLLINIYSNRDPWPYLVLINLRVFLLTFITFLLNTKINLFKAFAFSQSFTFLLVITYSQISIFQNFFISFQMAKKSRTISSMSNKELYQNISALIYFFFNKTLTTSKEVTQAMQSRAFIHD